MAKSNNTYLAYGIRIDTPFPIEDLPLSNGEADVTIREGAIPDQLVDEVLGGTRRFENPGAEYRFTPRAMYARWDRVGKALVRNGSDVLVEREDGATQEDFGPFVTGPVLAALLHQRGYFVLHASCVSINGKGAVFVGHKGHGKSTLAALLKARGHQLISDDIVPLSGVNRGIWIKPGFPRIKLYDDSIEAIGADPTDYPTIHRFASKRSFQVTEACDGDRAVRVHCIYILHESEQFQISQLPRTEAFIEIMKNAHLGRFLEETHCQSTYFQLCSKLAQTIPIFRLDRPTSFSDMPQILAGLEAHASQIDDQVN